VPQLCRRSPCNQAHSCVGPRLASTGASHLCLRPTPAFRCGSHFTKKKKKRKDQHHRYLMRTVSLPGSLFFFRFLYSLWPDPKHKVGPQAFSFKDFLLVPHLYSTPSSCSRLMAPKGIRRGAKGEKGVGRRWRRRKERMGKDGKRVQFVNC